MPRPPVMPLAYGSTGFRLSVQAPSEILERLKIAGADLTTIREREVEDRLNEAVVPFLDARLHAVDQKPFRDIIKALRVNLTKFERALPNDFSALAIGLYKHWQYGGRSKSFSHNESSSNVIGVQTPIAHLRGELLRFSEALNTLAAEAGVGKAGRTAALEDHEFIGALAVLYGSWTNKRPTQGICVAGSDQNKRSRGQFPDFVRAIDDAIHDQMSRRLEKGIVVRGKERKMITSAEVEELVKPFRISNLATLIGANGKQSPANQG